MYDLPPYVEAKDYIRVRALVRGQCVDAVVLGWRGDRVYLTWRSNMGNHLGWVPAADVERSRPSGLPNVAPPSLRYEARVVAFGRGSRREAR